MRKMIYAIGVILILAIAWASSVTAEKKDDVQWLPMEATAYCYGEITADGSRVREGICAAKPEWYGKTAAIYEDAGGVPGEFIGYYECLDTGGDAIKSGDVIDIYSPSYEWCVQFGRRNVLVFLIDGVG